MSTLVGAHGTEASDARQAQEDDALEVATPATYDALIALARDGDPLIDPDRPDSFSVTEDGLIILGQDDDNGRALDVRVVLEGERMRAWVRDPAEHQGEPFLGREWAGEAVFHNYDDLVHWAYSW